MNLTDALRSQNVAQERDLADRQRFHRNVCQCCGYSKKHPQDPECVCDGIGWYMDKGGAVECQAHRFARAIGAGKRRFFFGRAAK